MASALPGGTICPEVVRDELPHLQLVGGGQWSAAPGLVPAALAGRARWCTTRPRPRGGSSVPGGDGDRAECLPPETSPNEGVSGQRQCRWAGPWIDAWVVGQAIHGLPRRRGAVAPARRAAVRAWSWVAIASGAIGGGPPV